MTIILTFIIYNLNGEDMIIYIDILLIINFIFDLFLLLTVNIALKRYTKIWRLFLSALVGVVSLISLFIPLKIIYVNLLKLFIAVVMVIVAFGFKNIYYTFYNVLYFYMVSIILGGFLYFLKIEFNIENTIYYGRISTSYLILLGISPIILYIFLYSWKFSKKIKNYYYKTIIVFSNDYILNITGYLDTGNKLIDPITNKPIILINKKLIKGKILIRSPMYVPINTVNGHNLIECVRPKKIIINDKEFKNYLIGICDYSFKLNGIDCLLNERLLEEI